MDVPLPPADRHSERPATVNAYEMFWECVEDYDTARPALAPVADDDGDAYAQFWRGIDD